MAFASRLLLPPGNAPSLDPESLADRQRANDAILADPESAEVKRAIRAYRVRYAVYEKSEAPAGQRIYEADEYVVVEL